MKPASSNSRFTIKLSCCLKFYKIYKNAPINVSSMSYKYFLCIPCIRIKCLGGIQHLYLALVESMYFPMSLNYFMSIDIADNVDFQQ